LSFFKDPIALAQKLEQQAHTLCRLWCQVNAGAPFKQREDVSWKDKIFSCSWKTRKGALKSVVELTISTFLFTCNNQNNPDPQPTPGDCKILLKARTQV